MVMKILNFLKKKNTPLIESQIHYSWIIHHVRSTDRVFFGPFKSYKEVDAFFDDPKNKSIQCSLELLISPDCPQEQYWYNPNDYLRDKHPYLFDRDPQPVSA
jgi:hypothetical protein